MRVSRDQAALNRKRVLEMAATLFRENGFDGVGVAKLMRAAGLTHGGFYGQFSSKDQLAAQALAGALDQAAERWRARAGARPDDPLGAILGYYLSARHRDSVSNGCAISALSGEMRRQSPAVRSSFTAGLEALIGILAENVEDRDEQARRSRALAMMASITGAVILARAVDDEGFSAEILDAMSHSLGLAEGEEPELPGGTVKA